ncbi:MAG: SMP-30/gluconolactonase/LRE family protein [Candidatus Sulfopaludibacter sp.]|nr:SMP-30/gluconolactonase/LRE family protein [Candidatus Sulfopaludibacter sp.]
MRDASAVLCAALLASATSLFSQSVEKLDPALDRLVPAKPTLVRDATGFNKWIEGPVWIDNRTLLFAEIPGNNIMRWRPGEVASVFLHPSGYKGSAPFGGPEPGSNGMTLDAQQRLTVAGHAQRDVWRLEKPDPWSQVTVLADKYQGKQLNSPNDLVYRSDGSLYFTDPPYGLPSQSDRDPARQLRVNGVYRIAGATEQKPGSPPDPARLQLLIQDLPRPNGIALSPDEKFLYVDNSGPKKLWMRYRVQPDGSLTGGKLLYDATSERAPGNPDGMKVDREGNIYSAGPGGVWIFSAEGKHLGTIKVPETVSNMAWGGYLGKTLYMTASTSIYSIQLNVEGVRP